MGKLYGCIKKKNDLCDPRQIRWIRSSAWGGGNIMLRRYRIIQRVRIGAKICAAKRRKTAGILFVLQGFATHLWGKSAAKMCVGNCAVMP